MSSSCFSSEEGSEPSHPPLTETRNLCELFMKAGSRLYSSCPDLFSNAMVQLSNKLSLELVKNPSILRSSSSSSSSSSCPLTDEIKQVKNYEEDFHDNASESLSLLKSKNKIKHPAFRKYVLPKDAPPEYYQCMECGERRPENSFQNDHTHFGMKPQVRWYCPLCDSFFAVTHRGGHIKCKHPCSESSSPSSSPVISCISSNNTPKKRGRKGKNDTSEALVSSSPKQQEPFVALAATLVKEDREEEEQEEIVSYDIPAQKRIRMSNEDQSIVGYEQHLNDAVCANNVFSTSSTDTTTVYDPTIVRVPSLSMFFQTVPPTSDETTSSCGSSELFQDDFSTPGYVLIPHNDDDGSYDSSF